MAGVFLSYDRDDADRARHFARALEGAGHTVWWDLHVRGGAQFGKVIEEALKAADAVVVLWSKNSVESAWVKDEAAAGRDSGRLVPVTLDGTEPPLGFRQFQTIHVSRSRNPSKAKLSLLLDAVASLGPKNERVISNRSDPPTHKAAPKRQWLWLGAAVSLVFLLSLGVGWWAWSGSNGRLPVVEVAPADRSPGSQAAASDLFVKLGSLAQIGKGKWLLVDAAPGANKPDLLFRTAETASPSEARANVVLLGGKANDLLWSREFAFPAGGEADLRQQMSLTVGRVLGCALEARANGGLQRDVLKIFLDGCAQVGEIGSNSSADRIVTTMRSVLAGAPRFTPAWGRLLLADVNVYDIARSNEQDVPATEQSLRRDMEEAHRVDPNLPEVTLAEAHLLPLWAYGQALDLLAQAKARAPDKSLVYADEATALLRVGRMADAIASARRAAELDPLSPAAETQLIMTFAYGGQIEDARHELQRAEKLWAGTGALRDAEFAFHLRYGDPKIAAQLTTMSDLKPYLAAREDPSPANIEALLNQLRRFETRPNPGDVGFAVQALADFHRPDDVFRWLGLIPAESEAEGADILFRPAFAEVRRDPRFLAAAKRLRLVDYWEKTGNWPDFCSDRTLPYDCKKEAAKLSA